MTLDAPEDDEDAQKTSQQVLEESHERLTTILHAMDAKIYVADMDTHEILFMNQSLREIFGKAEGQPCYKALQGLDAPCPFCTNDKLVSADGRPTGAYIWEFQNQLNSRWYELRDSAVRWTDGRLVRMEVANDITERKQIELGLRQSEERFRLAFENANTGMYWVDLQGRMLQVNDKMSAIFGYSRKELEGMTVNDLTYTDDLTVSSEYMSKATQGLVDSATFDKRYRHRDGHLVYGEVASSVVRDHEGQPLYFISQVKDVTAYRLAQAQLRASEERFRLVVENAVDNIWSMDTNQRMRYLSPSIATLGGYSPEEFRELSLEQILMPDSLKLALDYLAALDARCAARLSIADFPFRGDLELRSKDGTGVWTEIIATPLVDAEGRLTELQGVTRDIRERKRYETELSEMREATEAANQALQAANTMLHHLASTDQLTGLWNRHYFEKAVSTEIGRTARYGEKPSSLLLFDIDHFKSINDTYGHLVGDEVLIALALRVRQQLRATDVLARWGGEEFVVLLPHTRGEDAVKVAEHLQQLIATEPFSKVGRITSSFGVAEFRPGETANLWLKRVDDAVYAAKTAGRNRVCMHQEVIAE